jgi:hypothetical protein
MNTWTLRLGFILGFPVPLKEGKLLGHALKKKRLG